jgi:hypothetical protein
VPTRPRGGFRENRRARRHQHQRPHPTSRLWKAGVRYRYYVSTPVLHGEAKTASAGSVSRVPAADIEDVIVKSLKEHLVTNQGKSATATLPLGDRGDLAELVAGIVVHRDRLSSGSSWITQMKHPIVRMTGYSRFPGISRPPKDPARSCSRTMHLEATSVRSSSSAGPAWSAPSREVVGGWMMLSQVG